MFSPVVGMNSSLAFNPLFANAFGSTPTTIIYEIPQGFSGESFFQPHNTSLNRGGLLPQIGM